MNKVGKTTIFYFSGTGNSFDVARSLSLKLENCQVVSMADGVPEDGVGGDGDRIGFIFPVYYGTLPRYVHQFIEQLRIEPGTYCFAVATLGAVGSGAISVADKILRKKDISLAYGKSLKMVRNYVMMYNPPGEEAARKLLDKAAGKMDQLAMDIREYKRGGVKRIRIAASNLYQDVESLDKKFYAEGSCTKCGLCAGVCPVANIEVTDAGPRWLHHCEHCTACIQWCPVQAIQYGRKTKKRRRYTNPNVKAADLISEEV